MRRHALVPLLATLLAKAAPAAAHAPAARAAGTYTNPVLDADFPDPMIMKARDGWYYAYATGTGDGKSTRHVSVARSRDLVRWEAPREALPAKPRWARKKGKFWAPHVVEAGGRYVMYLAVEPDWSESEHMRLAVATAAGPGGPFVDAGAPMDVGEDAEENLDAMAFDDPRSGKPYLYWGLNGEVVVRELAPDRLRFAEGSAAKAVLGPSKSAYEAVTEGPWVTFRDGWYYLYYSGDDCCTTYHYAVSVARARSPEGPFQRLAEATGRADSVVLAGAGRWKGPGHNAVLRDARGEDWLVYHAVDAKRPTTPGTGHVRRAMLLDRITYRDGWPAVAGGVPSGVPAPRPAVR
jgi:arabinan endo-1,5-alpha-L-arabinosidase